MNRDDIVWEEKVEVLLDAQKRNQQVEVFGPLYGNSQEGPTVAFVQTLSRRERKVTFYAPGRGPFTLVGSDIDRVAFHSPPVRDKLPSRSKKRPWLA